jgi:hypothetical protein
MIFSIAPDKSSNDTLVYTAPDNECTNAAAFGMRCVSVDVRSNHERNF